MTSPAILGPEFEKWQSLTDEYERELQAMRQGVPGARDRARKLSSALRRLTQERSDETQGTASAKSKRAEDRRHAKPALAMSHLRENP